jgi:hypothetical protein
MTTRVAMTKRPPIHHDPLKIHKVRLAELPPLRRGALRDFMDSFATSVSSVQTQGLAAGFSSRHPSVNGEGSIFPDDP